MACWRWPGHRRECIKGKKKSFQIEETRKEEEKERKTRQKR